jgi:hypothetical protein
MMESMAEPSEKLTRMQEFHRAAIEIGFIIFLFYANLLMGEFTRSHGPSRSLAFALRDILTWTNFSIGFVAACIGHWAFEHLRRRL